MSSVTNQIPVLETQRLKLRGPEAKDFEPVAEFFADAERSWGFGGPLPRTEAWRWFSSMIGHWVLRGYGFWIVETHDGQTVGMVGLWFPEGWDEPELGYVMFPKGEGKGLAIEAATKVRQFAYEKLGFTTLCSNIFPGNTRSVGLAERMGAIYEGDHENITHGTEMVYRHPAPGTAS